MYGLPIMLAALSLMGAPATPVACNSDPVAMGFADGLTWNRNGQAERIELSARVCAGLVYMAATDAERVKLAHLNPDENFLRDEGVAAVVILHESHHVSGDHDETSTECAAMAAVGGFISAGIPARDRYAVQGWANGYDHALPLAYHERVC